MCVFYFGHMCMHTSTYTYHMYTRIHPCTNMCVLFLEYALAIIDNIYVYTYYFCVPVCVHKYMHNTPMYSSVYIYLCICVYAYIFKKSRVCSIMYKSMHNTPMYSAMQYVAFIHMHYAANSNVHR